MSEPLATNAGPALLELAEHWRSQLRAISAADVAIAEADLAARLAEAETSAEFRQMKDVLSGLEADAALVSRTAARLMGRLQVLEREWRRTRRYVGAGLLELRDDLRGLALERPKTAARRWLSHLLRAIEAGEWEAAHVLAEERLPFPESLLGGVAVIRESIATASESHPPSRLMEQIATRRLQGWEKVPNDEIESRARRLAAWAAVALAGDLDTAKRHLDAAVALDADPARCFSERAALHLLMGATDPATSDAQHAIDGAPADALGYASLGACFELAGDFGEADRLYGEALERLTPLEMSLLGRETTIARPTGRLLLRAAARSLDADEPRSALTLLEDARRERVLGPSVYPEADLYRLRGVALEKTGAPRPEVAAAAYEAGQRYLFNQDDERAIEQLERAVALDAAAPDAGWLLADALLRRPEGSAHPGAERVRRALDAWNAWTERRGLPSRTSARAYVTRAYIADFETSSAERSAGRVASMWEAAGWLERALALEEEDALIWASSALYLRNVSLMQLALDAIERASAVNPDLYTVLVERHVLLAIAGRLDEAADAGQKLIERYGAGGWVNAVQAWVLGRLGRSEEALGLLRVSLGDQYDPGWYRMLAAVCLLRVGEVPPARRMFAHVIAEPGSTSFTDVAVACAAVGDLEAGARAIEHARHDPGCPRPNVDSAQALLAFARGDVAAARKLLESAVERSTSIAGLREDAETFPLLVGALPDADEELRQAAEEILSGIVPARIAELEGVLMTPDLELALALEEVRRGKRANATALSEPVLLAIRGRRAYARGDLVTAADVYESLLGGWFEHEARMRLRTALEQLRDLHVTKGAVRGVREIEERLEGIFGASNPTTRTLALTSALAVGGQVSEAKEQVREELGRAEPDQAERLHRAHAELELLSGNLVGAIGSFNDAVEAARSHGAAARAAQYQVRLALIMAAAGKESTATRHLRDALSCWAEAEAFDPDWALGQELRGLAWFSATREAFAQGRDVLMRALEDLAAAGELEPQAIGELPDPVVGEPEPSA